MDTDPSFSDAPTLMGAERDLPAPRPGGPAFPGGLERLADRYQLEEPIASGGAATVWRAFDDILSRSVAIKLLHPHLATDPTTVERFRLESINAAKLTHPNVVAIYDTGQEGDIVYLVMEYVDGPSLRDILRDSGPLEPEVVAALGEQVAGALGEAHAASIVHRDIKPANILVNTDGVAKVTDFGIAKALSGAQSTLTSPGTVVGTAAYVAPEQLEGTDVDPRADVYSLGVVLYECLTGQPAFQGDTPTATAAARLTHELLPPRQVRADVPRALDEVIVRATRRDRQLRFEDAQSMATALAPLVSSRPSEVTASLLLSDIHASDATETARPVVARPLTRPRSVPLTRGQYGRRMVGAFIGGLILAVGAFLAIQNMQSEPAPPDQVTGTMFQIASVADFDPAGNPPREHADEVPLVFDGNIETAWTTERYRRSADFGGLKPGVGLAFDLGESRDVSQLALDLATDGISLEVYAQDELPDEVDGLLGWRQKVATVESAAFQERIEVTTTARYWLVWITQLKDEGDGTFTAGIQEARFIGQ